VPLVPLVQMEDSLLLDGMLKEYQSAFQAVDTSGNGTLGEYIFQAVNAKLHEQILHLAAVPARAPLAQAPAACMAGGVCQYLSNTTCYAAGGSEVRRLFEELGHPLTDQKLFDVMERFDADGTVREDEDKQDCPDVSAEAGRCHGAP